MQRPTDSAQRNPSRIIAGAHAAALAGATALALATSGWDRWHVGPLVVIGACTILSGLMSISADVRLKVDGSTVGVALVAVILGGGPAAALGVLVVLCGWPRRREPLPALRNNLVNHACTPLVVAVGFHLAAGAAGAGPQSLGFYLLAFVAYLALTALSFLIAAGFQCHLDGVALRRRATELLVPVLPAELASAALMMGMAYVVERAGTAGATVLGLVLVIFQYLIKELLTSKRRSRDLHRLATTDKLTGLANRDRFGERVRAQIAQAAEGGGEFAVMLIDLDRFKEVNDTLGHPYGDELLRTLGPRLTACVGGSGMVGRLGGDEFVVLTTPGMVHADALRTMAGDLVEAIAEPVLLDDITLGVGASVGVARFPADGTDLHALLRHADVAMYDAKQKGVGCQVYNPELDEHSVTRLRVFSDFRRALEGEELEVFYQPIFEVDGDTACGAEGLVRWRHPEAGLLAPAAFVPLVEQTELVGPLTRYVLERCIAQCASWRRSGLDLVVSVNLSVRNLLDRTLPRDIERLLHEYDLPAEALKVEITESMLMSDPAHAVATVTAMSALGVRIAIDDFGTGYSSLANLRRLPIDELKIDRSFVSPMLRDESDLIIVRSTINLGHDLGLRVVAEGVEDGDILRRVAGLGCDLAQGYLFTPPLPADEFVDWVGRRRATPLPRELAGAVTL